MTLQSSPKTRKRSKPRMNQRSWVTAMTVPSNSESAVFERLGRREVEVVGRLVEQEQRGAVELEQQDLEARLLAARQRLERLVGAALQLVAAEAAHRRATCLVAALQDLGERAAGELGMVVGLAEEAGDDVRAEAPVAVVARSSRPASRWRKWLLPVPFGPRTATRSPNQSSASNGSVSPSSSSRSRTTARLPVRAPPSRIVIF